MNYLIVKMSMPSQHSYTFVKTWARPVISILLRKAFVWTRAV